MKQLYKHLLAAFALLAFVPVANALDDDPPYIDDGSGICYSKKISKPNTEGVYTITLESFVTGSVTLKNESVPADIVLVLDVSGSMANDNKMDNLKTAVKAFIDEIHTNDLYIIERDEDGKEISRTRRKDKAGNEISLGNQISIVKFAMNYYGGNSASITPGDTYGNLNGNNKGTYSQKREYNATQVRVGFTKTDTDANITTLKNAIDGLRAGGATAADYGMNLARLLINSLPTSGENDRSGSAKTVVFFTDGSPTHSKSFNSTVANSAVTNSRQIKQSGAADAHPQVFSVGVFSSSDDTSEGSNIDNFMNAISSNHPSATSITNRGAKESTKFYTNASSGDVDLKDVFTTIAQASGGSDRDLTDATVAEVDVVSASFTLPEDLTGKSEEELQAWADENIKVYTAPYLGTKTGDYLDFGENIPKGENTATYRKRVKDPNTGVISLTGDPIRVDGNLGVKVSSSGNVAGKIDRIDVTGFDYANNFCGEDDLLTSGYNGHKVIIEIPIKMDPTAVGGPDVATNADGSGIYINGENVIKFKSPEVSLPVNMHIRKEGLKEGESAKFTIQRKLKTDPETAWIDVTSVFVTRHKGDASEGENAPMTKVLGMPATDENDKEFVYRIVEDNWSWSYTSSAATPVTSDLLEINPFIFVNTPKDDIDIKVRHAESKASNIFKPKTAGSTVVLPFFRQVPSCC